MAENKWVIGDRTPIKRSYGTLLKKNYWPTYGCDFTPVTHFFIRPFIGVNNSI